MWGQQPATDPPIEPLKTAITISERISAEAPASITVFGKRQLAANPGVNIDDRLRTVPGFTLFRRTSSLVANPTTQGVSMRGLGSSGASRTLVLWDGVPANSPFGTWVYWNRFSPDEMQSIEISRGASTSLFGDRAMGGMLALISRQPEPWRLRGSYEGGNRNTHQVAGGFSHLRGPLGVSLQSRAFTTAGYYIVPGSRRGDIDTRAGVDFAAGEARVDYLGSANQLFVRLDILAEQRDNGTRIQRNSTGLGAVAAHYSRDALSLTAWHTREEFRASFSQILADRNTERLTSIQSVPSDATGGAGLYRWTARESHLMIGGDLTRVEGYSRETSTATGLRTTGGTQWQRGAFVQADTAWRKWKLFSGLRIHNTAVTSAASNVFLNPSAGLTYGAKQWRGRATIYRSFRAPSLNELYRDFRVGNAVTLANAALKPEFSRGAEAGADWYGETRRASVTFFQARLTDLITNVTLSTSPSLIERQRRNAARALTRGIEVSYAHRWRSLHADLGYLFSDSRFELPAATRIPQIPRHQGSFVLTWSSADGKSLVSGGLRSFDNQFEDEINQFRLPGYATLQFTARRALTTALSAFLSVENLLNREFIVAFSPTPNIGAPRLWRAGLRWEGRLRK